MKIMQVTLFVEDVDLEKRITDLEDRCEKLDISLQTIFSATAANIPYKPFVDVLLSFSDIKIADIESAEKTKRFFNKFKIHKKSKNQNKK